MAPSFLRDVRETWVRNGRPGEQPPSPKSDFSVGSLIRRLFCGEGAARKPIRGPFLEGPGNFTGSKSNIQIEI